jgi:hypothetical protein
MKKILTLSLFLFVSACVLRASELVSKFPSLRDVEGSADEWKFKRDREPGLNSWRATCGAPPVYIHPRSTNAPAFNTSAAATNLLIYPAVYFFQNFPAASAARYVCEVVNGGRGNDFFIDIGFNGTGPARQKSSELPIQKSELPIQGTFTIHAPPVGQTWATNRFEVVAPQGATLGMVFVRRGPNTPTERIPAYIKELPPETTLLRSISVRDVK